MADSHACLLLLVGLLAAAFVAPSASTNDALGTCVRKRLRDTNARLWGGEVVGRELRLQYSIARSSATAIGALCGAMDAAECCAECRKIGFRDCGCDSVSCICYRNFVDV